MAYPPKFRRPIPLEQWMNSKGFSQAKTAKFFGNPDNDFTPASIQKMLANQDRDVGVWDTGSNSVLVETVALNAISVFADGRNLDPQEIYVIKQLNPRAPLGPNPSAKRRGPPKSDQSK